MARKRRRRQGCDAISSRAEGCGDPWSGFSPCILGNYLVAIFWSRLAKIRSAMALHFFTVVGTLSFRAD